MNRHELDIDYAADPWWRRAMHGFVVEQVRFRGHDVVVQYCISATYPSGTLVPRDNASRHWLRLTRRPSGPVGWSRTTSVPRDLGTVWYRDYVDPDEADA